MIRLKSLRYGTVSGLEQGTVGQNRITHAGWKNPVTKFAATASPDMARSFVPPVNLNILRKEVSLLGVTSNKQVGLSLDVTILGSRPWGDISHPTATALTEPHLLPLRIAHLKTEGFPDLDIR